jgi:hypothetical protein
MEGQRAGLLLAEAMERIARHPRFFLYLQEIKRSIIMKINIQKQLFTAKHTGLLLFLVIICMRATDSLGQTPGIDSIMPVRGLAVAAPSPEGLERFLTFIEKELAPAHFNMLILRVDWGYEYVSHPELRGSNPLSKADIKRIVAVCRKHGIAIAPQVNLLGHQSWAKHTGNLLAAYPELDETPHVKTENFTDWPNPDGLYCKSYCPLHPDLHRIVFAIMDEVTDVFETDLFHAGMDEVFYIGDPHCPRCAGHDKAELFAGEVTKLHNHLSLNGKRLLIWGDRLIDGRMTGIGEWEASMNNTHRAIDLIPKDVFICDWHYERAEKTPVYFAMKGFDVAICPWRKPDIALAELADMIGFRQGSTPAMSKRFRGIIATVWSGNEAFLQSYYTPSPATANASEAATLRALIEAFRKME